VPIILAGTIEQSVPGLRLDPNNSDALFNIGFVKWQAQGNRKAAIAAWQKLLETNPNHPKRAQVEELLTQAKRHAEAPMAGTSNTQAAGRVGL
jgi:cytochrome c-type biogenesis protein CcmH/NrfG